MFKFLFRLFLIIIGGVLLIKYVPMAARTYARYAAMEALYECMSATATKLKSQPTAEVNAYLQNEAAEVIRNCSYERMNSFARGILDPRKTKFSFDQTTGELTFHLPFGPN